jgi:CheY-like chemotaxis protein
MEEVMRQTRELHPSLITLDVLLAGETGWNILSMLKSDPQTADIPVLVISAVDERGIGCAFGVEDYLVKPVTRQQLLNRLQSMGMTHRAGKKFEVLVIDDHEEARLLLRKMLENESVHVIEACGGQEGIDAARITVPDLVLLDLMMPDVSGFDVLQALRSNPSTRSVPVIIVTAKEITAEDTERLNGDVQALLRKASLSGGEFVREVRRVLKVGTRAQEAVHA